jgi:hypothetical protein
VALPVGAGIFCAVALLAVWRGREPWRQVGARLSWTLGALALTALPWAGVLSFTYGRPTFSTSARIAHAVVGPGDADRYHPTMQTLHQPAAGRLTSWEDPSRMPYRYWSPWAGKEYLGHQLRLIGHNATVILWLLGSFDCARLGLAAAAFALVRIGRARGPNAAAPRTGGIALLVVLAGAYLPVYVGRVDARYFYLAWPLLFGSVAQAVDWAARRWPAKERALRWGGGAVAGASFAIPAVLGVWVALQGVPNPAAACAQELAPRLQRAGLTGPVAGSGLVAGGRTGLFVAYLLGTPWLGDAPGGTPDDFRRAGARLVVAGRRQPLADTLRRTPGVRQLDDVLFATPEEAAQFPVAVFRLNAPSD